MKKLITLLAIFIPFFITTLGFAMDAEIKSAAAEIVKAKGKRKADSDASDATPSKKRKKRFVCEQCNKELTTKGGLTKHMRTHSGEQPFKCTLCNKAFTQVSNLNRHIKKHTGEQPYECKTCKKRYSDPSDFKKHTKTHMAERERLFKCGEPGCEKDFMSQNGLTYHTRTHTGEKSFKCTYPGCEKTFASRSNLNRHTKEHPSVPATLAIPSVHQSARRVKIASMPAIAPISAAIPASAQMPAEPRPAPAELVSFTPIHVPASHSHEQLPVPATPLPVLLDMPGDGTQDNGRGSPEAILAMPLFHQSEQDDPAYAYPGLQALQAMADKEENL